MTTRTHNRRRQLAADTFGAAATWRPLWRHFGHDAAFWRALDGRNGRALGVWGAYPDGPRRRARVMRGHGR